MKKIKLILFDIDNTLVYGEAAKKYYQQYPIFLEKMLSKCLYISLNEAKKIADEHRRLFNGRGEKAFETYNIDFCIWNKTICTIDPNIYIQPLLNIQKLLVDLRNDYLLGAVTDGPTQQAYKILKAAEIDKDLFSLFIGWEFRKKMPKGGLPDVFKQIISQSGLSPSELLMVGDSVDADIIPAHTCGINVLHINDVVKTKFPTIKQIEMLPDYLKKL